LILAQLVGLAGQFQRWRLGRPTAGNLPTRFGGIAPQIEGLRLGLSCPSSLKGLRQGNHGTSGG
jgi:hypothetical protein